VINLLEDSKELYASVVRAAEKLIAVERTTKLPSASKVPPQQVRPVLSAPTQAANSPASAGGGGGPEEGTRAAPVPAGYVISQSSSNEKYDPDSHLPNVPPQVQRQVAPPQHITLPLPQSLSHGDHHPPYTHALPKRGAQAPTPPSAPQVLAPFSRSAPLPARPEDVLVPRSGSIVPALLSLVRSSCQEVAHMACSSVRRGGGVWWLSFLESFSWFIRFLLFFPGLLLGAGKLSGVG
jgi:hypothetical protein